MTREQAHRVAAEALHLCGLERAMFTAVQEPGEVRIEFRRATPEGAGMSDAWIAVVTSAAVSVVIGLGPYAWMLLPKYWERRASPEELARITQQYVDDYWAGFELGAAEEPAGHAPPPLR